MIRRLNAQKSLLDHVNDLPIITNDYAATPVVACFSYIPLQYSANLFNPSSVGIHRNEKRIPMKIPSADCAAEVIAQILVARAQNEFNSIDFKTEYSSDFYQNCIPAISCSGCVENDHDIITIRAKQIMMFVKKANIQDYINNSRFTNRKKIYYAMFSAFWDLVPWEELFPSLPAAASLMQDDRYLLAELLLSREGVFCVDECAEDYFDMHNRTKREQLLYVSFFDFTFVSILRLFGIVEDVESPDGRVRVSVTPWGRAFLSSLDQ